MSYATRSSTDRRRTYRGLTAGLGAAILLFAATPVSARLIPRGEVVFPDPPGNGFIGLAPLAGKGVVVAWVEPGQEVLRAQELEADLGFRRDFEVAGPGGSPPALIFCPQVARLGRGRLAFAWSELDPANDRHRVAYRVLHEDGSPRSPIRYAQGDPPRLDEGCPNLSGGDTGFVIGWNLSLHPVGPPYRLRARTFSVDGVPTSPPIDLATSESLTTAPQVVADRDGGFAAAWSPRNSAGDSREIVLRRFHRAGTPHGRIARIAADRLELQGLVAGTFQGYELIWSLRQGDRRSLEARRFDRNLVAITPARIVFAAETPIEATGAVDRKARTALLVSAGGILRGFELNPGLQPCGAAIRVNVDLPQGTFPVVVSAPNEVTVAGVEASIENPLPKLIVRRYALGACEGAH